RRLPSAATILQVLESALWGWGEGALYFDIPPGYAIILYEPGETNWLAHSRGRAGCRRTGRLFASAIADGGDESRRRFDTFYQCQHGKL
ncbi:MAG: hypothetical protein WCT12_29230, partial [Verrucomicrobiota bacterium]